MREQLEMAAACGGADSLACLTTSSPSLILDAVCVEKTLSCAELRVPMILVPGISLGSSAPASLQTAVAMAHAEVMASLVLHQLANPSAPFVYGTGISQLDMRTLVDLFTSPEIALGLQMQVDLAHSLKLPSFAYAGCSDAKIHDQQWSAEVMASTLFGALSRATLLHDVGYMESGLLGTQEALVMGDELAGYARAILEELPVDDEAIALAEIEAVGPGGNHLGTRMTRRDHRRYWRPSLIDQNTHERWAAGGRTTLLERVRARLAEILAAEPAFALDAATERALDELSRTGRTS